MRKVLGGAAQLGALALGLALLAGCAGMWAWPLELFANFRVQYAVLFLICTAVLLALQRFAWALPIAVAAAATWVSVFAYVGWPTAAVRDPATTFRFITFNVWFRNGDLRQVADYLEHSDADAVVLLELDRPRALQLQKRLPSYRYAHIGDDLHGAVIFSRWPLLERHFEALCTQCVSVARVRLDWQGREIELVGAHLHWPIGPIAARLRAAELRGLARLVRQRSGATLLGGDFNLTPWSRYYAQFVVASGLADCARGQGWRPTWPSSPRLLGIRIDHCFASSEWHTAQVSVGPQLGSDHLPNVVDLSLPDLQPRQRGRLALTR